MENYSSNSVKNAPILIYKFGNCYLNPIERKLFKDGKHLELTSKTFDILQILVAKSGEIVTKEEILDTVWEDSFVEEGNLPVHISKLRKLLNATKTEPFIDTVINVGYRFVSRVNTIAESDWENLSFNENSPTKTEKTKAKKNESIAILPLINENGNEEIEYLADGLTESLINTLAYTPNLRVLARNAVFQYKNKEINIQEIGKELNVDTVLTGRLRVLKNNLIIGVELTKTSDRTQLWGTQFNQPFEDIFEMQDKITLAISENLKSQINNSAKSLSSQRFTNNAESYKLYLKGRYFFNRGGVEGYQKAIEYLQQSISHDPTNVLSYTGLADCYLWLYFYEQISLQEAKTKVTSLLKKSSDINQSFSELYVLKGCLKMYLDWDVENAEKHFRKALVLNPNNATTHYYYANLLANCGRSSEALDGIKEIMKLDPISSLNNKNIAKIFYKVGQYENAIIQLKEALDLEESNYEALLLLGTNLIETGKFEEALEVLHKTLDIQFHLETFSMIGYANARARNLTEAKKILKQIEAQGKTDYIPPTYKGIIYSALGEIDKTFECLENAFKTHYPDLFALKVDPRWENIKRDKRFNKLLSKIGLPID